MPTWAIVVISVLGTPFLIGIASVARGAWRSLAFPDLAIRVLGGESKRTAPEATLKLAYVGNNPLIIEAVSIKSRLGALSRWHGLLAWPQLINGYIMDDRDGLQTVLGMSFPVSTRIPGAPVHRIEHTYLRRTLSWLFGLVTLWYLISFLLNPLAWPLLFAGPYGRFELVAPDEAVQIKDATSNDELTRPFVTRPFVLKPSREQHLHLSYQFSLKARGFSAETPYAYVNEAPKLHPYKLPRPGKFVWQGKEVLLVRVRGKWREYPITLGTALVSIGCREECGENPETRESLHHGSARYDS